MKFIKVNSDTIFEGDIEKMNRLSTFVNIEGRIVVVDLNNLERIEKVPGGSVAADYIANSLKFGVSDFMGKRIYSGRKKGLRLYCVPIDSERIQEYLVLSFGEFQPGRFLCIEEGIFSMLL
ncbi:hypothetical protein [Marinobacter sp. ANT_B65]|uniref:hypothetical protein n=1 Tax=Marinobacter sp. ANT_B65 TaxID=2039467 RepID=UPI000BBE0F0C|nr:hypothetical protein [Marinobacter sp. ANT_B65]PCM44844.1 hypothetical protein CPA50_02075 [Marinobacter sp. ANT_B65]